MKKLFTLSLLALILSQFTFAQDQAFFTPPEGSTYNADSTIVTLPDAQVSSMYNEVVTFFAPDVVQIEGLALELSFVSATITGVTSPEGLDYSCNTEGCVFLPNTQGEVTLEGIPSTVGVYDLEITAGIIVLIPIFGEFDIPVPYNGENVLLNGFLGEDYSAINSLLPGFILNVNEEIGIEEFSPLADVLVYPNPATTEVYFEYTSANEDTQVQIFDLLGNIVFNNSFSKENVTVNTSNFTNGVYIYKLSTLSNSAVGRLIVNK